LKRQLYTLGIASALIISFVVNVDARVAKSSNRKVASVDALQDLVSRCEKVAEIGDQIDCYGNILDDCAAVYPSSRFATQGNAKQFKIAFSGAKTMCEVGSAFLPSGVSGADQCLVNASKAIALYCVGVLSKANEPGPFAPSISN
jgi:hypothetical protein